VTPDLIVDPDRITRDELAAARAELARLRGVAMIVLAAIDFAYDEDPSKKPLLLSAVADYRGLHSDAIEIWLAALLR